MSFKNKLNIIETYSVEALQTIKSLVFPILALRINLSFFNRRFSKFSFKISCVDTLQYIYDNFDTGHYVIPVFLYFAIAFDPVDNEYLFKNVSLFGVRGGALDWLHSYLTQPKQNVSINGISSGHRHIEYGVPQRCILSPLLFLIIINDFPKCSNIFNLTLFAEDSTLTCNLKNTYPHEI